MVKREAQDGLNVHQMAITCDVVVHISSLWGYSVNFVCSLERLGVGVAQLGGVGGVVGGNCNLVLLHVVLGNERCA